MTTRSTEVLMNKNLGWKLALIIGTLLFFLFGIVGVPNNWSGHGLLAAIQQRIHLGLDLKGGTHLILQVQVNDAVKVDSDNAIERLKQDLRTHKINYTEITHSTAMLEIRQALGGPYSSEQQALQEHNGVLPPDAVLMKGKSIGERDAETGGETWYLISRSSAVTGRDLRTAEAGRDENGQPDVRFTLTGEGGRRFYAFTSAHVGEDLAVVLDNKVQEKAVIKEPIRDTGVINGRFTEQQAKDLAMILRSGALPAGIKYLEERTVGPALGEHPVRAGVRAARLGSLPGRYSSPAYCT